VVVVSITTFTRWIDGLEPGGDTWFICNLGRCGMFGMGVVCLTRTESYERLSIAYDDIVLYCDEA